MYKGMSVHERDAARVFSSRMDDKSKGFSTSQLNSYIDTCMEGYTEEQKLYMANRILSGYEEKRRMTESQGDNMTSSL